MKIKLIDLTERSEVHGTKEGKDVYQKLAQIVSDSFHENTFNISMDGIKATDASFPRESVLAIAKQYRDEGKWFFLSGEMTQDTLFNWNLAAEFKDQPLVLWNNENYKVLGPKAGPSLSKVLEIVMDVKEVTASDIASKLDLSIPNASSKLKKLSTKGFISRCERTAESGGIEFVYKAIK